jgi:hypothetical protein
MEIQISALPSMPFLSIQMKPMTNTQSLITVNLPHNGLIGGTECPLQMIEGVFTKHTVVYVDNTRNNHRNTQCDYIKFFILGFLFILNSFLTAQPS